MYTNNVIHIDDWNLVKHFNVDLTSHERVMSHQVKEKQTNEINYGIQDVNKKSRLEISLRIAIMYASVWESNISTCNNAFIGFIVVNRKSTLGLLGCSTHFLCSVKEQETK